MKLTLTHWSTAIVSTVVLFPPVWLLSCAEDAGLAPMAWLFGGRAFADRPLIIGGALDQPGLHKEFFILCYSLLVLCPFIAVVRWLTGRSGHRVRRVFAFASLLLFVHPISVLTIFAYDVSRYILRLGVTPMRLVGMALALVAYAALFLFAAWVSGFHRRRPNDTLSPPCGGF